MELMDVTVSSVRLFGSEDLKGHIQVRVISIKMEGHIVKEMKLPRATEKADRGFFKECRMMLWSNVSKAGFKSKKD